MVDFLNSLGGQKSPPNQRAQLIKNLARLGGLEGFTSHPAHPQFLQMRKFSAPLQKLEMGIFFHLRYKNN